MTAIRSQPCTYCPYKRDCPSGVWSHDQYEMLRRYDRETWGQPFTGFACHATPGHYCCGWAVVHSNRGHEHHLLALRYDPPDGELPTILVALFSSGDEAADHGQADISDPSPEAIDAMVHLVRKHPRLTS